MFKVGDRVKILDCHFHNLPVYTEGVIKNIFLGLIFPYEIALDNRLAIYQFGEDEIELIA